MDISRIGQASGLEYVFALKNHNSFAQKSFSTSPADTVSISNEAMEKYLAVKHADKAGGNSNIASQVSSWYDNFRENMGMVDDPDVSSWPQENQERRKQLTDAIDAIAPHCSNTQFTENNKKLIDIQDKLMALDAIGNKNVITDSDMTTAVNALHESMERWGGNEKFNLAASLGGPSEEESRVKKEKILAQMISQLTGHQQTKPEVE